MTSSSYGAPARQSGAGRERSDTRAVPWPRPAVIALAIGWLAVAVLFGLLAVAAHANPSFAVDRRFEAWVDHLQGTAVAPGMDFFGDLAGPVGAAIAYVIILGAMLLFRLFKEALCTAVAGLGAEVANIVVNALVGRPRPPAYHGSTLLGLGGHSFPSGHTADALGLYGFLFYLCLVAQRTHPRWRPWLIAAQAAIVVYLVDVGVSRIMEQQHWPSDVLAGYLLGALTLTLGIALYHRLSEAPRPDSSPGRQADPRRGAPLAAS